jgi:hypothetical protein
MAFLRSFQKASDYRLSAFSKPSGVKVPSSTVRFRAHGKTVFGLLWECNRKRLWTRPDSRTKKSLISGAGEGNRTLVYVVVKSGAFLRFSVSPNCE